MITPEGKPVWLKIVQGILVLDLVDVRLNPQMIPEGEGEVKYRSARQVRKKKVESKARALAKGRGGLTYADALAIANSSVPKDTQAEVFIAAGVSGRI